MKTKLPGLKALMLFGVMLASSNAYSLNSYCGPFVIFGTVFHTHRVTYSIDEQLIYGILHYQSIATRLFPRPNIQLGVGSPVVMSIVNRPSPRGHYFGIFGSNFPLVRWQILGAALLSSPFEYGPSSFCNRTVTISNI